ncbi:MAG: signal recognition particle-docking protein FtsY [Candidatus Norongarragalinales archaeon]
MFGFLKKAVTGFISKVTGKEEKAHVEKPETAPEKKESVEEEIVREVEKEVLGETQKTPEPKKTENPLPAPKREEPAERETTTQPERKPVFEAKQEKKELTPKVGLLKKITGMFTGSITIGEAEVAPLFEDLRIALLESDVSLDTTEFLIEDLRKRIVGKQVARGSANDVVKAEVRMALLDLFQNDEDFIARASRKEKPVKIMFLGPNGAGKTTTIAKIAFLLKQKGLSSVIAASDTFRAAAIEQAAHHGEKLGIRVIKHKYGADPAAVAFDAIAHAKAEKIDFVLIDTAGRQETNYNLVKEMEKINRVIQPDFKVFVGESVAGHALIEQARKFHESVGLDGLVLTKLDADAKGGTAFSIAHDLRVPILFIGVGQNYEDLKPFAREWLVNNVLS